MYRAYAGSQLSLAWIMPRDAASFLQVVPTKKAAPAPHSSSHKRERILLFFIVLLLGWNIALQIRRTESDSLLLHPSPRANSYLPDGSTHDFVNPEDSHLVTTYGSAGIVCSGCSSETGDNTSSDGQQRLDCDCDREALCILV